MQTLLVQKDHIGGRPMPSGKVLDGAVEAINGLKYARVWSGKSNVLKWTDRKVRVDSQARKLQGGGANVQIQLNDEGRQGGRGTTIACVTVEKAVDDFGGFEVERRAAHQELVLDLVKRGL